MPETDQLTGAEQYLIELLNRARLDPVGEAARYGIDLNEDLSAGTLGTEQRSVLAPNDLLHSAAEGHSQWMLDTDTFSHTGQDGSSSHQRMEAAGYEFTGAWSSGENIAFSGTTGTVDLNKEIEDQHEGLFLSAGHRVNILNGSFREIGVAQVEGVYTFNQVDYNTSMLTENFATSGSTVYLTGAIYNDIDGDDFYSIGEGVSGVGFAAGSETAQSLSAGGYALGLSPDEAVSVTATYGANSYAMTVDMSAGNVKLDFVDGTHLKTTGGVMLTSQTGDVRMTLLGTLDTDLGAAGGNDVLTGNAGVNLLSGGAGNDVLRGAAVDSTNAEYDAVAAQVYRIYQATLGRAPDDEGHFNWTQQLSDGDLTATEAVAGFVGSAEFQNTYGATTDAEFVDLLYQNVLNRDPDAAGLQAWLDALTSGNSDREDVVLGFSDSAEFIAATGDAAQAYSFEGHTAAFVDDVYRLYQATLGRTPDVEGLTSWAEQLAGGADFLSVVSGFVNSTEFQNAYGATTDDAFVTLLYQNVLGRAPDAGGLASWTAALEDETLGRTEVVEGFAQSAEFVAASDAALESFMRQTEGDRFDGGAGDDVMYGTFGSNTFIVGRNDIGHDTIIGLEAWDTVDLTDFGYANADAARAMMTESDGDVVFADNGVTITFEDLTLAQISDTVLSV